jgi:hypothetical protein
MKRKILRFAVIVLIMAGVSACRNVNNDSTVNSECAMCESKTILRVLKDEEAYIKKGCYIYLGETYSCSIILANEYESEAYISKEIFPCGGVPEKFQIDSLPVLISGNIMSCAAGNECLPPCPECKLAPTNFLELKTINAN